MPRASAAKASTPANSWPSSAELRPIPTLELTPRVTRDIARGRDWWLLHRDKAPFAFDEELDRCLDELEVDAAHVGTAVRGASGLRRVLLKRIRFYVYFRIVGSRVRVLALWHASRAGEPNVF